MGPDRESARTSRPALSEIVERSGLPVAEVAHELDAALAQSGTAVLSAAPGSGKTTLAPLLALAAPWSAGRKILLLEPRRLAARLAAARMAALLGETVGQTVGYRVRFERRVSSATRVEVLTEGTLVRRLQRDPELADVGLVIFDEVHERNLETDLALAFVLDARAALRPDLRVLAMSATLDAASLGRLLAEPGSTAPHLSAEGRVYPVDIVYRPAPGGGRRAPRGQGPDLAWIESVVLEALRDQAGDVLVFLPGAREIARMRAALGERLAEAIANNDVRVSALHAQIDRKAQDAALQPSPGTRRVILATNIAESSLTIEGISVVVDGGYVRVPRLHPASGLSRLETVRISQASATQRSGRAGRLGPGVAYRAWSPSEHARLARVTPAQIAGADLTHLVLEVAAWGVGDLEALAWLDTPPDAHVQAAWSLLRALGAVDRSRRITPLGRLMVDAPTHPRLARMLVASRAAGEARAVALAGDLAALIEGRSPLRAGLGAPEVDLVRRQQALAAYRQRSAGSDIDRRACAELARTAKVLEQWARSLRIDPDILDAVKPADETADLLRPANLVSIAYPDRIALRRPGSAPRFRLANGRGARLGDDDALVSARALAVAHLDAKDAHGRVQLAAELTPSDIIAVHRNDLEHAERIEWDASSDRIEARRERRLGALVLERAPLDAPDPAALAEAMLDGVSRLGLAALPWTPAALALRNRSEALRAWIEDPEWPALDDPTLAATHRQWLGPYLGGMSQRQHLARLDLTAILRAQLGWERERRLQQGAPSMLTIPSGREVALEYDGAQPPVLAARLQEFFGLERTPTVAWGRIPVRIHLLSPAGRPLQVTQDIGGFWRGSYAEVRREMRGRYPKHHWPEDPLSAVATTRVRPR